MDHCIELLFEKIQEYTNNLYGYVYIFLYLGITLWEMCTFGHRPYENIHARDLLDFLEKGNRLPQPETTSLDFYCLMLQCKFIIVYCYSVICIHISVL